MHDETAARRSSPARVATVGAVSTIAAGLVGTAFFGVGAVSHWDELSDGSTWLWSTTGEVARVNAHSGRVELAQGVEEASGHPVRLAQNGEHVVVHDLATGTMTSIDLVRLENSGTTRAGAGHHLVFGPKGAVVVDREAGEVRRVDPETLRPIGEPLRVSGPIAGGAFDGDGLLWFAVPSQGTAVAVDTAGKDRPEAVDSVAVGEPGADLVATVLDTGALVADRDTGTVTRVGDGRPRSVDSPVPLAGAEMPERTRGGLAPITVPDAGRVVAVGGLDADLGATEVAVHGSRPEPALAFAGRIYVPQPEDGAVREFAADGTQNGRIDVPGGDTGELHLELRDGHLFINAPSSELALIVAADGSVREVSKYEPEPEEGEGGGEGSGTPDGQSDHYAEGPDAEAPERPGLGDASTPDEEGGLLAEEPPARPEDEERDAGRGEGEDAEAGSGAPPARPEEEEAPEEGAPPAPPQQPGGPLGPGTPGQEGPGQEDPGPELPELPGLPGPEEPGLPGLPGPGQPEQPEQPGEEPPGPPDEETPELPGWPGPAPEPEPEEPPVEEPPAEEEPPVEEPAPEEPPVEEPAPEEPPMEEPAPEPPVEEPPVEEPPVEQPAPEPPPVEEPPVEEPPVEPAPEPPPVEQPPVEEPAPEQPPADGAAAPASGQSGDQWGT
ncbi:hypothetical protein [Nocardiopsis potens]|uniref:hypothetical protein n=1 Tax=Nocardiopsis potens TaxID=1246458 RepID=UPI000347915A|nr:hypothetical protein [Nocardiopsis potens]